MSNRSSVSAVHDRLANALPVFLTDPNFTITLGDFNLFEASPPVQPFPQFGNNSSEGYSNVQITYEDLGPIVVDNNPENIGVVGAANAGFGSAALSVPAFSGVTQQVIKVVLTGERGGETYRAEDTATVDITIVVA